MQHFGRIGLKGRAACSLERRGLKRRRRSRNRGRRDGHKGWDGRRSFEHKIIGGAEAGG